MKFSAIAVVFASSAFASLASAQELLHMPLPAPYAPSAAPVQMNQQERHEEAAELRYRLQQRIEIPLAQQRLDAEIALAEAEMEALDRHIAEYERISRPRNSNPFLVTLDAARLARLNAQLRLDHLQQQKLRSSENFHSLRRLRLLEIMQ